ncbi:MAG: Ig-like domain-containing protein, partial [Nitrospirota bacterium]
MRLYRLAAAALLVVQVGCGGGGNSDSPSSADAGTTGQGEGSVAVTVQWPSSFTAGVHASSFGLPSQVLSLEMTIQVLGPDFSGRAHTLSVTRTLDGDVTVLDGEEVASNGARVTLPVPVGDPRRIYITGHADLSTSDGGSEPASFAGSKNLPTVTGEPGLRATVVLHADDEAAEVPVIETLVVSAPAAALHVGEMANLAVSAIFSDGFDALQPLVTYATSDAAIAEVDADGRVSIVGKGSVTVTISGGDATTPLALLIENIPPKDATITNLPPDDPDLPPGESVIEVDEDGTATATVEVLDVDDATHDLAITVPPSHGTVTIGSDGTVTYLPDEDYSGDDSFEVVVTDPDGGETRVVVTVHVTPVADPPALDPIADQTNQEGDAIDVVVSGSDPDGDTLSYAATGLPPGMSIDPTTGSISGALDFTTASGSPYTAEVTVSDGSDETARTFTWTVLNVPFCGDGAVDPGEACDDGNTTGGDGCAADCSKTEVCGDNTVDVGEACDDGNTTGG